MSFTFPPHRCAAPGRPRALTRRRLLAGSAGAVLLLATPAPARAAPPVGPFPAADLYPAADLFPEG